MDPTACLLRLLGAIEGGDANEAVEASADFHTWLCNGGFLPVVHEEVMPTVGYRRFVIDVDRHQDVTY